MKSRVLTLLNAGGCLVLTGVLGLQWAKEKSLRSDFNRTTGELHAAKALVATEVKRSAALERDITALKEAIEATRKAADLSAQALAETDNRSTALKAEIEASRSLTKTWQDAIATRDARLVELNAELTATRQRLDQAVNKLRSAGAR